MRACIALGKVIASPCPMGGWSCDKYLTVDGKKAELSWDDAAIVTKEFSHLGAKRVPGMGVKITLAQARLLLS